MAAQLPPSLADLRESLITRCGLASGSAAPTSAQRMLDERIRQAQKLVYEQFPWATLRFNTDTDLTLGETDYDIPDDTDASKIEFLGIRRISDGYEFTLEANYTPTENSQYNAQNSNTLPLRYIFIDGIIRLAPPPDTTYYDKLMIIYRKVPGPMIQDEERCVVDAEALLLQAEILVKAHFGGMDLTDLKEAFARYMKRIQAKQSDGGGFQMGGHLSLATRTQQRNRFSWSGLKASTWRDWRPW